MDHGFLFSRCIPCSHQGFYCRDGDMGQQLSPCAVSHREIQSTRAGNRMKEDFRFLLGKLLSHSTASLVNKPLSTRCQSMCWARGYSNE